MPAADLFEAHINTIHTDFSAWRNLFADDAILEMPFGASAGIDTTLSGVNAIAESVGGFVSALRDPQITVKNVYQIAGEDAVVAEFAMTATVIPTGKHYTQDYICYLRVQITRSLSTVNTSTRDVPRLLSPPNSFVSRQH